MGRYIAYVGILLRQRNGHDREGSTEVNPQRFVHSPGLTAGRSFCEEKRLSAEMLHSSSNDFTRIYATIQVSRVRDAPPGGRDCMPVVQLRFDTHRGIANHSRSLPRG